MGTFLNFSCTQSLGQESVNKKGVLSTSLNHIDKKMARWRQLHHQSNQLIICLLNLCGKIFQWIYYPKLNKISNHMSQNSGKSLLVELIFRTLRLAGELEGPQRRVLFYIYTLTNYIFERYYTLFWIAFNSNVKLVVV